MSFMLSEYSLYKPLYYVMIALLLSLPIIGIFVWGSHMDEAWLMDATLSAYNGEMQNPIVGLKTITMFKDGILFVAFLVLPFIKDLIIAGRLYSLLWFFVVVYFSAKVLEMMKIERGFRIVYFLFLVYLIMFNHALIYRPEVVIMGMFVISVYLFISGRIKPLIYVATISTISSPNGLILVILVWIYLLYYYGRKYHKEKRFFYNLIFHQAIAMIITVLIILLPKPVEAIRILLSLATDKQHSLPFYKEYIRYIGFFKANGANAFFTKLMFAGGIIVSIVVLWGKLGGKKGKLIKESEKVNNSIALLKRVLMLHILFALVMLFLAKNKTYTYMAYLFPLFAMEFTLMVSVVFNTMKLIYKWLYVIVYVLMIAISFKITRDIIKYPILAQRRVVHREETKIYSFLRDKCSPYTNIFGYVKLLFAFYGENKHLLSFHAFNKEFGNKEMRRISYYRCLVLDPFFFRYYKSHNGDKAKLSKLLSKYKLIGQIKQDYWSLPGVIKIYLRRR